VKRLDHEKVNINEKLNDQKREDSENLRAKESYQKGVLSKSADKDFSVLVCRVWADPAAHQSGPSPRFKALKIIPDNTSIRSMKLRFGRECVIRLNPIFWGRTLKLNSGT